MRILFLTYNYIPPDQPGSIRAWQIANYLLNAGHQITVLTSGTHYMTGGTALGAMGPPVQKKPAEVNIVRLSSPVKNPRRSRGHRILHDTVVALRQTGAALDELPEIDLVLSASPPILTPLLASLVAKIRGTPHVFEVRDILADGLVAAGIVRKRWFVSLIDFLEKLCFRLSDGLVAVTPGIRRLMLQKGVPERKMILVTNGVEDELYREIPDRESMRDFWNVEPERFVVFFSGTLSAFSNVGLLLDSARLLKNQPEIFFLIAGEGQKRREYEQYCRFYRMDNVRFLGARPRAEIPGLCAMSDICVHMFKEGPFWDIFFSNKMFDYMGAGRPVVYSGGGDSADLIRQAGGGLVVRSEDPVALAEGIHHFWCHPEEKARAGENARRYILQNYSRKKLLASMETYLRAVAQQNGRRAIG